MQGTANDLYEAIKSRRYEILLAREGIQSVQEDLKSKRQKLEELEVDLSTLERALSILQGKPRYTPVVLNGELPLNTPQRASRKSPENTGAVFSLAEDILRIEGKPLTVRELLPQVLARRAALGMTPISREGMSGVLYRFAKSGKIFYYLGAGRFGLLEWREKESIQITGERSEGLRVLP